jgi:predicted aminopeptidase
VKLPFLSALLLSGCYLTQAAAGQFQLLHDARSLRSVTADPKTPPRLGELLSKVPAIKRFGQFNGLTPTDNYRDYVDLHRSAAVYVVQGCHSLKFEPRRWSFPIVGSVPYLGYFDENAARAFASELERTEHIDVTVRTAQAYSTLGWFHDAVLSTMVPDGPEAFGELANVILHESVHATVYVPNQSAFDESLASYVADELTWQLVVGRSGLHSPQAQAWQEGEARAARWTAALRSTHDALAALYAADLPDADKHARKDELLSALQKTLHTKRRYNNADLAGVRTYDSGKAAFARLRRSCGSWPKLFEAVRSLTAANFTTPQQHAFDDVIDGLRLRACPALTSK